MRIKICGITKPEQGKEIVQLGATALGFICVERSPRYIEPQQIKAIINNLDSSVDTIGVFANAEISEINQTIEKAGLSGVQLHGSESPQFCQQLKKQLPPQIEIIKAFRIENSASLKETFSYTQCVDTLLLDAYHPQMLGGTGKTLDWSDLQQFQPSLPWMLAGGLTPQNVKTALDILQPDGIDLSSGVERSPGDKDISKVTQLLQNLF
jgi:phosphoribosylanthranilate isomerase